MNPSPLSKKQLLQALQLDAFNEMQQTMHAACAEHSSLMLIAPTGSGKTLGFLVPLLAKINPDLKAVQCLILTPSRELAMQIFEVWKQMKTPYKATVCYGGHSFDQEVNKFKEPPYLLIGTPGRVLDHIQSLPSLQQRILVSATSLSELPAFIDMQAVQLIDFTHLAKEGGVFQLHQVTCEAKDKLSTLHKLLLQLPAKPSIIFANHRASIDRIADYLIEQGISAIAFHGGMEQKERDIAMAKFINGSAPYLIATDLAARGLDIDAIHQIVHYQMPIDEATFVHRNGRTARMFASGDAYLLVGPEETLPAFIDSSIASFEFQKYTHKETAIAYTTLLIEGGKKDKISKGDIAGFLMQKGNLKKEEIGLIIVKDIYSFVAIQSDKIYGAFTLLMHQKLKTKKCYIKII
ncbi:MAG: DEAD/DEAH box helicase [Chitinophagia bacterium]|nr:DEAD/DEAH box helicase [Chitinophagia bacterium]